MTNRVDSVSGLTDTGIELQTSRADSNVFNHYASLPVRELQTKITPRPTSLTTTESMVEGIKGIVKKHKMHAIDTMHLQFNEKNNLFKLQLLDFSISCLQPVVKALDALVKDKMLRMVVPTTWDNQIVKKL